MYAYLNQYVVRKMLGMKLINNCIDMYEFNNSAIEVVNDLGIVNIVDKNLFIYDSVKYVKFNGCFPANIVNCLEDEFITKMDVGSNDIVWHKVLIEDNGINISRAYSHIDSIIYQIGGKQIMNSTSVDEELVCKRHNDVRLIRAIGNGLRGNTGKVNDRSSGICDYLENVNINNVCYILGVDKNNKLNIMYANGTIYFLINHNDYVNFSNVVIDIIVSGYNYINNIRQLAFCKNDVLEAGNYIIDGKRFNIQKMSELHNLVRYILKTYNSKVEIIRSGL